MRRWVAVLVGLVACEKFVAKHPVKPADEEAWANVPLVELEKHPVFSTIDREERTLSDGTTWWVYQQCRQGNTECRGGAVAVPAGQSTVAVGRSTCSGGGVKCCHHQFTVKDDKVIEYHARGECLTSCEMRPSESAKTCTY